MWVYIVWVIFLCCLSLLSCVCYLSVCHCLQCDGCCGYMLLQLQRCACLCHLFFYEQDESESSEHILLHFIIYLLCDILLCSKSKQLCVSCLLSLLHIYCLFTLSFVLRCSWLHTSNVMPSVMPSSVLNYGILFCWCYNMKWMQCSRPIGRKWNGGCFVKKVENGGVFVKKSGKWGCFFV